MAFSRVLQVPGGVYYNHQQQQQQQSYPGSIHRMAAMSGASIGGTGQQGLVMGSPVVGAPGGGSAVPPDDQLSGGVGGGPIKGGTGGGAGKGSSNSGANGVFLGHQQRSAPYPNPQQYMQSKRAQFANGQTPSEVNVMIRTFIFFWLFKILLCAFVDG